MNKCLKLREGEYLPETGMQYPEDDPFAKLLPEDTVKDISFDGSYPFLDESLKFKLGRTLVYTLFSFISDIRQHLVFGIRYKGREVLRKYREELSQGPVCVCNHCYRLDGHAVSRLLHKRLWIPMLPEHIKGRDAFVLRHFGGIPLPEDAAGMRKFNEAFDTLHSRREWIHVFPEGRNWHYYKPLKPFITGAFTMAYRYGCPILPLNISYRERKGIYKLFAPACIPLITITVGEPIFPDTSKPRKTEVLRLLETAHAEICSLGGIIVNPWPAVWNGNQSGNI